MKKILLLALYLAGTSAAHAMSHSHHGTLAQHRELVFLAVAATILVTHRLTAD